MFLHIGGESEQSAKAMHFGFFYQISKQAKALRVNLEHRFYGKSRPTE